MKQPLIALCALFFCHCADGGILVYEGFDGYNSGALAGQNATNATGVTGSYTGTNFSYKSTGLTFGALRVSGGAASGGSSTNANLSINLASSAAVTGDLWASYLVSISGVAGNVIVSVGSDQHFKMAPTLGSGSSGKSGVTYSSSNYATAIGGSTNLAPNTTYMVIAHFTNVGLSLSAGSRGIVSYWILTEPQFGNFVASGLTETYLTSTGLGTDASGIYASASIGLNSGSFLFDQTQTINFSVNYQYNANNTFDEMRFGTTLADVAPIPEPSTAGLGLAAIGLLSGLRELAKKRRR